SRFEPDEDQLNELADKLSSLGFFVNALQYGNANLDDFLPADQRQRPAELDAGFELDFDDHGAAAEPGHEQTEDEPTATLTATAAPPTSDAEIDAELLDIFIEEAHCVLDAIHEGLS